MNTKPQITREQFIAAVGCEPQDDDLERCNCTAVGIGHSTCGWNEERNLPQFMCGPREASKSAGGL